MANSCSVAHFTVVIFWALPFAGRTEEAFLATTNSGLKLFTEVTAHVFSVVLFVPFWTDTKNSYLRVRHCAQARAIENECYVVIAGSVGNLPQVESLDVQYSQSAVLTPSDFSFPHDATLNEATPNTEMLLFSDLDMDKLKILHSEGTVRNLKDRREDLYEVILKKRDV